MANHKGQQNSFICLLTALLLAALLSACSKKTDESLAFIDETEKMTSEESSASGTYDSQSSAVFTRDWNQNVSEAFGFGGDQVYYAVNKTVYAVDLHESTYRPLCQKPGCEHRDESCYAWLGDSRAEEGSFQVYEDGLYQAVYIREDPENPILRCQRIDPRGEKPKRIAYEIPLRDLSSSADQFQADPQALLHRGYAVIHSTAQLDPEEPWDPKTEEDYDPENPWNETVRTMHYDFQHDVSLFNLETGELTPLLSADVKGRAHSSVRLLPYGDELLIIISSQRGRPEKETDGNGSESYSLGFIYDQPEIYRFRFGSAEAPQKIEVPPLPFDDPTANFAVDHGEILMIGERTDENGRTALTLCSLDPDSGELSPGKEICELRDDRLVFANYGDGYLYLRDFRGNPYVSDGEFTGEDFTILDYSIEMLSTFSFNETLPSCGYSFGAEVHGSDAEYLYCKAESDDDLRLYRIPIDGRPAEFFTDAGAKNHPAESDGSTEEAPEDSDNPLIAEEFPDYDPASSGTGDAFCQTAEYIFFFENTGPYGQSQFLRMADKKTGRIETLCGRPGCRHDSESCEAFRSTNGVLSVDALTATDRRCWLARLENVNGSILAVRAFDPETKAWSEVTSLSLMKAGIGKKDYTLNDLNIFFHRDCLYLYCVRNTQAGDGIGPSGMRNAENTILIYELPLLHPDQGRIIFEEEYPEAGIVSLKAGACGGSLIFGVSSAEIVDYDEEGGYIYDNEETRIRAYDLGTGEIRELYDVNEQTSILGMYPEQDALNLIVYRNSRFSDGFILHDDALMRLDYESGKMTEIMSNSDQTVGLYFSRDGYFTIRKKSRYADVGDLSCSFFDFNGEEIRAFSYPMPEALLPEDPEAWDMWHAYLGADAWNLYIRDSFFNADEGYSVIYSIPISGDQPVIFWVDE
ncbi:MAG: hypothetical protein IKS18_08910 [Lachnospiraceae bacterium]|nr:hypothetical protein [Lachnospiraceae bacterium]